MVAPWCSPIEEPAPSQSIIPENRWPASQMTKIKRLSSSNLVGNENGDECSIHSDRAAPPFTVGLRVARKEPCRDRSAGASSNRSRQSAYGLLQPDGSTRRRSDSSRLSPA